MRIIIIIIGSISLVSQPWLWYSMTVFMFVLF